MVQGSTDKCTQFSNSLSIPSLYNFQHEIIYIGSNETKGYPHKKLKPSCSVNKYFDKKS